GLSDRPYPGRSTAITKWSPATAARTPGACQLSLGAGKPAMDQHHCFSGPGDQIMNFDTAGVEVLRLGRRNGARFGAEGPIGDQGGNQGDFSQRQLLAPAISASA